jgi:hypothetical protein
MLLVEVEVPAPATEAQSAQVCELQRSILSEIWSWPLAENIIGTVEVGE